MTKDLFAPFRKRLTIALIALGWICFPTKSLFAAVTTYQAGWLDTNGTFPLLHLSGTETEMGEQYGYLAGHLVKANIENLIQVTKGRNPKLFKWIPDPVFSLLRRTVGLLFWNKFPDSAKEHINGMVKGAKKRPDKIKINKFDVAFLNSIIDLVGITDGISENIARLKAKLSKNGTAKKEKVSLRDFFDLLSVPHFTNQCDTFAAWGPRTQGGKTFQTRNTDLETGEGLEKYPITIIFKRTGKIPVIAASFVGMTGVFAGMNAFGVGLGQVWGFSYDVKINTPWQLVTRDLFMESQTAEQVAKRWKEIGSTTYGTNFIFADAGEQSSGQKVAYAVEASARSVATFHGNDPKEQLATYQGQLYSLPLDYAIARADFAMDPKLRSRSYGARGPDGDPRNAGSYRDRYLGQIQRIVDYEKNGVLIGQPEAETISRETAVKDGNLHNSVYANTDREIWIAVAKVLPDGSIRQAFQEPYVHVPFNQYLVQAHARHGGTSISFTRWAPTAPTYATVAVTRNGQRVTTQTVAQLDAGGSLSFTTQSRDIIEVFHPQTGELIDRTLVQ